MQLKLNYCKKVFFLIHLLARDILLMNKIEGTPILKLAMVKRLKVKKFPKRLPKNKPKNIHLQIHPKIPLKKFTRKIYPMKFPKKKIHPKNSSI